jgi:aminopeptidase N
LFLLSRKISFNRYLTVLSRYKLEADILPAQEVSDQLALLYTLVPSGISETSRNFHHTLLKALNQRTDEKSSILRGTVATRLALIDPAYAAELGRDFKDYGHVPPDMRLAVATAYARSTNDIEGLTRVYNESSSNEDRTKFLDSMTTFSDEGLVRRTLDFALSGEVKRQDVIWVVLGATENHQAKDMTWNWLKTNIDKLQGLYQSTGLLSQAFMSTIPILCVGRLTEAEDFFATHQIPDADIGIKTGLEKLHVYDRLVKDLLRDA